MKESTRPRIKICCIASLEEAWMAIDHGASAIGLVSEMPSGPGVIPEDLIAEIAAKIPPALGSFLLTSRQEVESIIEQQRRLKVNTLQISIASHPAAIKLCAQPCRESLWCR